MGLPNENRGLRIPEDGFVYLSEGAYSIVFVHPVKGRVKKVFKKNGSEAHCRDVQQQEVKAYNLAMQGAELKSIVPKFYGSLEVGDILDDSGANVVCEFYPHLAYEMDYVPGPFRKINPEELEFFRPKFAAAGIFWLRDASINEGNDGKPKIIDFAVREIEAHW